MFSRERGCYSADPKSLAGISGRYLVTGLLERFARCDGDVEFLESFLDYGDPESPVPVECAVEVEDDAFRPQNSGLDLAFRFS
jgi:hypothetical protein